MDLLSATLQRLTPAEELCAREAASAAAAVEFFTWGLADDLDCRHCTKTRMVAGDLRNHCEQM
jgi:hypothetical protein